jgi:hypothetical protein
MPLRGHGSGSLAFPAPSCALAVASRAFEGFHMRRPDARRPRADFCRVRAKPLGLVLLDVVPACFGVSTDAVHLCPLRAMARPQRWNHYLHTHTEHASALVAG